MVESPSELLKIQISKPHSQRFCLIRSEYCLDIFMFTNFFGWFWCTCAVNSFLKNTKLGPLWGDFWSYSKYTYAFLFVPYPYPYPNNNKLCPITTVPFYLPRDHAWWKKYLVKDGGICCSKEPSKLVQSDLLCLSCEAAWCSTEFSKVLWHIDNYHKKRSSVVR